MHNPYIIQIDTATEICSVSLSISGQPVDSLEADAPNMHASALTVCVEEVLRRNGLAHTDLTAVAVSMGPGSYTGLRIGVSTAKGLCYGWDLPLIAINTLDVMFEGYSCTFPEPGYDLYCPMIDARRMEVYMSVFAREKRLLVPTTAAIIDENSFADYKDKKVVLFGSGAAKFANLFENDQGVDVDTRYAHSSANMSEAVWQKFQQKDFEDIIYFEPFYLKEFVPTTPKKSPL